MKAIDIKQLTKLWNKGLTCAQIAERMGHSRGSIQIKVKKLGLRMVQSVEAEIRKMENKE